MSFYLNTEMVRTATLIAHGDSDHERIEKAFEKWLARRDRFLVNRLVGILMMDDQVTEEELQRLSDAFAKLTYEGNAPAIELHLSGDASCD